MARVIWDQRGNPPKYVSDRLGIQHWQLGDAIHEIKAAGNLRAADRVISMMTAWSQTNEVILSVTPMMKSENTVRTFATLRFVGDALDPEEISRVVKEKPTRAYKKGQPYRPGPRSPEIIGKTGVWYMSTKHKVQSKDLIDHLNALERLISPFADKDSRLKELREIMARRQLQAHTTVFWRGPPGAQRPSIPSAATAALCRLPADIEPDFANEDC